MTKPNSTAMRRVAIIGGGSAGLAAYRHAIAHPTLRAAIFESSSTLGGLWSDDHPYHRPNMTTNISRDTFSFSDFPWPREDVARKPGGVFPYAGEVCKYLRLYAQRHVRKEDLRLSTIVTSVEFSDGKWTVRSSQSHRDGGGDSKTAAEEFDYLIIASGFFSTPYTPIIPGANDARISLTHSAAFTDPGSYRGRTVAIIGDSFSAVEIAGALSRHAAKIHHIHSRPFYTFPLRIPTSPTPAQPGKPHFLPNDLVFNRRSTRVSTEEQIHPTVETNKQKHEYFLSILPAPPYPLNVDKPPRIAASDEYTAGLRAGIIKPHLARLNSFDSDTSALNLSSGDQVSADSVIFGTGYTISMPFLPSHLRAAIEYNSDNHFVPLLTHRLVLHPDMPQAGFVGFYRGPYLAVMELQARYLASLFAGSTEWPSEEEMRQGIETEKGVRDSESTGKQLPHGDYGGIIETYARLLGLEPPSSSNGTAETIVDQILAANYPLERNRDVETIESDLLETYDLSARGAWVLGAVFRSWAGTWEVSRVIRNDVPGSLDGKFEGTATFYLRPPSDLPTDPSKLRPSDPGASQSGGSASSHSTEADGARTTSRPEKGVTEYLYHEHGTFTTSAGVSFQAHRKYIYRYHPSDIISAWFVKGAASIDPPDQGTIDYWFHDIVIEPSDASENGETGTDKKVWFEEHSDKGGWTASGSEHPCVQDVYKPTYKFCFKGSEVQEFGIGYDVRGPDKGYVSEAWYKRAE